LIAGLFLGFISPSLSSAVVAVDSLSGTRSSIRRAGDVNSDGVPDLLVSNCSVETPEHVWVLSGKDGSALLRVSGREAGDGFGSSMESVGDVDGDGHVDFIVGAPGGRVTKRGAAEFSRNSGGYARVHSGVDGRMLHEFLPKNESQERGVCVAGAGDVDADGRPDVIVGFPIGSDGRQGEVIVHSGRNGEVLHRFVDLMHCGVSASGGGDLDGDGHDDVLVGDGSSFNERAGRLRAFSGRAGRELFVLMPEDPDEAFPWVIASTGDMNSDRVPDILVSEESRFVRAISGKDGSTIQQWSSHGGKSYIDAFGSSLDSLGDIDGDGMSDVIVGANESLVEFFDEGYATLYSGKSGSVIKEYRRLDVGIDVSGLGDVDGDKVPDFVLCIPARHQVRFVSGKTFGTIREIDWTKLETPKPAGGK
jgi:hypothetical protein